MITHLRGILDSRDLSRVVIEAGGVGYEVQVPVSIDGRLPAPGQELKLFIVESTPMYGGGTSLYGFLTEQEREIFLLLRDEVPGAGAKKALEYMDKVMKSLPDFRRAVLQEDMGFMTGVFGFTKKTAEKIVVALKGKIGSLPVPGKEKWTPVPAGTPRAEAIAGLIALGYRENDARDAVEAVLKAGGEKLPSADIIRRALRHM